MVGSPSQNSEQGLREKLIALIESSDVELDGELKDDTSLIKSGVLDSLGLFNLALFVESEIGNELDATSFDMAEEWDTMTDIVRFVVKHSARAK